MRRVVLAITVVFAVVAAWSLPAQSAESTVTEPVALRGRAPGELQTLRISAFPQMSTPAGEPIHELVVEPTSVTIDGKDWSVSIDPSSIPSEYVHDDGVVDFTVYLVGSDAMWQTNASARAVDSPSDEAWLDPVESSDLVEESAAARGQRAGRSPLALSDDDLDELEDDGVIADGGAEVDPDLLLSGCRTVATDDYTIRPVTIGTSYPVGDSEAYMDVDSSQGAEYGVAVSASGDFGSFSASGSQFTQGGWGFTWNPNDRARSYRARVQYTKLETYCWGSLRQVMWWPRAETGGTGQNFDVTRPDWTHCQNVTSGEWRRWKSWGSSYSYGAAVKFASLIGIDLSITREYSSYQMIVYNVDGPINKMCGSDDVPSLAGKVMEKFR
jgi:hypothetical protein